jgi:hypothetical protein
MNTEWPSFAQNWLDGVMPQRRIRQFILRELKFLSRLQKKMSSSVANDLLDARYALQGIPEYHALAGPVEKVHPVISLEQARDWFSKLPDGKVLLKGQVATSCGLMLELLDCKENEGDSAKVQSCLESLLRHVEVRRRKALMQFTTSLSSTQKQMEKLDVIVLFARVAMRHQDFRFLNAALKLNDWCFRSILCSIHPEIRARGLLALAETEQAAWRVLR